MDFESLIKPKSIDEFIGQDNLTGKSSAFYKLVKSKTVPSCIFFGPSGTGKTTLAKTIASELNFDFYYFDAGNIKLSTLRDVISKNTLIKPLVFIDEIHRLSTTQQEALLVPLEQEKFILFGASTSNPYYSLTSALRSRTFLFEFEPFTNEHLTQILDNIEKKADIKVPKSSKELIVRVSNGDLRTLLNVLKYTYQIDKNFEEKTIRSLKSLNLNSNDTTSTHYDLISAFIKSIRGSNVDASLYYLAQMIHLKEDASFIARRLVILASEDIGNANPNALNIATSTLSAVSQIGYPEARIILAQCTIYLTSSPKSNSSYLAINKALDWAKNNQPLNVPNNIKQTPTNYKYPHDNGGFVEQEYLEKDLKFYESNNIGFEKTLNEWLKKIVIKSTP